MVALAAIGAPVRAAASADASRRPSSATSRRRLGGAPASIDSRRKARLIGRRETRDVRVEVIDPLSIAVGGALVGLGRGFLERADLSADSPVRTVDNGTTESRASVRADAGSIR